MIEADDLLHGIKVLTEYTQEAKHPYIKSTAKILLDDINSEPVGDQADVVKQILYRCKTFPKLATNELMSELNYEFTKFITNYSASKNLISQTGRKKGGTAGKGTYSWDTNAMLVVFDILDCERSTKPSVIINKLKNLSKEDETKIQDRLSVCDESHKNIKFRNDDGIYFEHNDVKKTINQQLMTKTKKYL